MQCQYYANKYFQSPGFYFVYNVKDANGHQFLELIEVSSEVVSIDGTNVQPQSPYLSHSILLPTC